MSEFFTVSQINHLMREVLQMGFPQGIWVCGEIQGFNRSKDKKHVFFDLSEKDPESREIIARIGLVLFAGRKDYILEICKKAQNAFELRDDLEVKFLCRVDFYPPHGAVRLVVEGIDPVYTLGKIAQEKQRLIQALKAKGIMDQNKALEFSLVPLKVGLITAFDSAAYNDFLMELKQSGYGFKVFFKNALMQGKSASKDVCAAIKHMQSIKDLDAIVITRGGGALAELSCFDSEAIASAIAGSHVPVLSGIGHEINITITDLAAHTYAKTPTAVAQHLIQRVESFLKLCEEQVSLIVDLARDQVNQENSFLRDKAFSVKQTTDDLLKQHHQKMSSFKQVLISSPLKLLEVSAIDNKEQKNILVKVLRLRLKTARFALNSVRRLIEVVNPLSTLRRGFSITRSEDGRLMTGSKGVKRGDQIKTQLKEGTVNSQVM